MEFLNVLLGPLLKIIDKAVPDKTEANKIQGEITKVLIDQQSEIMQTMKDITLKELDGSGYQRNWRPTLSWMVIAMWPYNYILRPMTVQAARPLGLSQSGLRVRGQRRRHPLLHRRRDRHAGHRPAPQVLSQRQTDRLGLPPRSVADTEALRQDMVRLASSVKRWKIPHDQSHVQPLPHKVN